MTQDDSFCTEDDTVRDHINDLLTFSRENCPHLTVIAATMLPFRDAMYRQGYMVDRDEESWLVYDIAHASTFAGCTMIAYVNGDTCYVQTVEDETGDTMACHQLTICQLWEFLRTIQRSVTNYGKVCDWKTMPTWTIESEGDRQADE